MDRLPIDVISTIIGNVPLTSLPNLASTSQHFRRISHSPEHFYQRLQLMYPMEHPKITKNLTAEQKYKLTRMLLRFENTKAQLIEIPKDVFSWFSQGGLPEDHDIYDEDLSILNSYVLQYLNHLQTPIYRGDIIHLESEGEYRNDGKYLFDGQTLVQLDYDGDDYGAIPPEYEILDDNLTFSSTYWKDVISHNGMVYFNAPKYEQQLLANLKKSERGSQDSPDILVYETEFIHSTGIQFKVFFILDLDITVNHIKRALKQKRFDVSESIIEFPVSRPYEIAFTILDSYENNEEETSDNSSDDENNINTNIQGLHVRRFYQNPLEHQLQHLQ